MNKNNYIGLFKFRECNDNLFNILSNSQLWFSKPAELNDPFDCRVDIIDCLENAIKYFGGINQSKWRDLMTLRTKHEVILNTIQMHSKELGLCSFSGSININENPLLWSHYANKHEGVCLMYKIPHDFVSNKNVLAISPVTYDEEDNQPLTKWFIENAGLFDRDNIDDLLMGLHKYVLTIKDNSWSYEGETRLIRDQSGLLYIDKVFLAQVTFGLHTDTENENRIKDILKSDKGYSHVDLTRMVRSNSDFGIEMIDI